MIKKIELKNDMKMKASSSKAIKKKAIKKKYFEIIIIIIYNHIIQLENIYQNTLCQY